ncbi:MAG: PEPxxWA-CTERM sorting domain-containing protein [Janthinobacterium lividum]
MYRLAIAMTATMLAGVPASANYVRATYTGSIAAVNPGTASNLGVGTTVVFRATYDTAKLVDRTTTVNDGTGLGFSSVLAASLSDDPRASLSISIGPVSFTKYDQLNYGTPGGECGPTCDLGAGNFPDVAYLNGVFAGIGNLFVNGAGYSFDSDPIADAFGGFDLGDNNGGYGFFLGRSIGGDPFAQILAVGNYDAGSAVIASVPEPAAWTMMIAGFGLVGLLTREHRNRARVAAVAVA